jgi:hypothetical protein
VRVWVNLAAGADMEAGVGAAVDALVLEVRSAERAADQVLDHGGATAGGRACGATAGRAGSLCSGVRPRPCGAGDGR